MMDVEKFKNFIELKCGLKAGDRIIVGVSGGSDSMCLVNLLKMSGCEVVIAHFDHQLRVESKQDAKFVEKYAQSAHLKYIKGQGDVKAFAQLHKKSIEDAGREMRYKFLFKVGHSNHAAAVVVGHTLDDQIETILMHLIRGCGLEGLQGMQLRTITKFHPQIPLIRPLLETSKKDIQFFCTENRIAFIEDSSNTDLTFFRNLVRKELVPLLERYNPHIKKNLLNLSSIVQDDLEILEKQTKIAYDQCILKTADGFSQISLNAFNNLPIGLQKRLILIILKELIKESDEIGFQMVEQVMNFLEFTPKTKHMQLCANIEISLEKETLNFYCPRIDLPINSYPHMVSMNNEKLLIPGSLILSPEWIISTYMQKPSKKMIMQGNKFQSKAYIDAESITSPLQIRTQKLGDRIKLLGLYGASQKLSDFWVNKKIPKRARHRWPLVFCENQLVWIPGFAPAHFCRLVEDTKQVVVLEISKRNN